MGSRVLTLESALANACTRACVFYGGKNKSGLPVIPLSNTIIFKIYNLVSESLSKTSDQPLDHHLTTCRFKTHKVWMVTYNEQGRFGGLVIQSFVKWCIGKNLL